MEMKVFCFSFSCLFELKEEKTTTQKVTSMRRNRLKFHYFVVVVVCSQNKIVR
jgi:hypothetical protein